MTSPLRQKNANADRAKRAGSASASRRSGTARPFRLAPTVSIPDLLDSDGSDLSFRQLLYDIAIGASHLESARSYLAARMNVTSPQYNMIMIIAQYEGQTGISVSEVASHLHVTNTFVTAEVKKLMRMGLVDKSPNPSDARSVLLHLTPEGEARVRTLEPELLFVNNHLFRDLSKTDFRHLSRIVASLIDDFARTIALLGTLKGAAVGPRAGRDSAKTLNALERLR
jgi:DNA-binding MarR family transcriptional regulator